MTEKPQVDFEEVVKASGMPVTDLKYGIALMRLRLRKA